MLQCSRAGRIHSELGVLFSQINRSDSNYILSIANRLYGTKAMAFHEVSPFGTVVSSFLGVLWISHYKIKWRIRSVTRSSSLRDCIWAELEFQWNGFYQTPIWGCEMSHNFCKSPMLSKSKVMDEAQNKFGNNYSLWTRKKIKYISYLFFKGP